MPRSAAPALALLAVVALPTAAAAEPAARVTGRVGAEAPFRAGPLQARVGEVVHLRAEVALGGTGRFAPPPEGSRVRWLRILPRMMPGRSPYSNSVLRGADHGRWRGYDSIEYRTQALPPTAARSAGAAAELRGIPGGGSSGAGTAWVTAEITLPSGRVVRAPGAEAVDALGLEERVMRVSFRGADDFAGWLATYFGVPYVFGSTGRQADRYTGADCADALVGARRASGRRRARFVSVRSLDRVARAVTPVLVLGEDGVVRDGSSASRPLRWGHEVRRSDMLVMDFLDDPHDELPGPWDHVGVLLGDRDGAGTPGVLDGADAIRHMAYSGLVDEPSRGLAPIRFRLFRWRRGY